MTALSAADVRVADLPSLTREVGVIYRLASGGFLVEIGDAYPVYQPDEGDARRFLRARGFRADGPVVEFRSGSAAP